MQNHTDKKKYYPTLVSDEFNGDNPNEGYIRIKKIQAIPQKNKEIILSDEIVDFVYAIEQRYHLIDQETEEVSRLIRQYFFEEITERIFCEKVASVCRISLNDVIILLHKMQSIVPKKKNEKIREIKIEEIAIIDAMVKYPKIKDQEITERVIVGKPFLQPLKPTLKNWIMVYEKVMGAGKHSAIERGEFMFRAEVTRSLAIHERELLAQIFRSRDENTPIAIDIMRNKIVLMKEDNDLKNELTRTDQNMPVVDMQQQYGYDNEYVQEQKSYSIDRSHIEPQHNKSREQFIQSTVIQDGKVDIQQDPRKDLRFDHLHQEILKNRMEMHKNPSPNILQSNRPQQQDARAIGTPIIPSQEIVQNQSVIKQEVITEEKQPHAKGKIAFSSNHTLPAEKSAQKTLQATKNYYHMTPIGAVHDHK